MRADLQHIINNLREMRKEFHLLEERLDRLDVKRNYPAPGKVPLNQPYIADVYAQVQAVDWLEAGGFKP